MNDANIEHLLRSMRPAAPSADLTARVERDMALAELFRDPVPPASSRAATRSPSRRATWPAAVIWAGLGAAAAVLIMTLLPAGTVPVNPSSVRGDSLASSLPAAEASKNIMPVSSSREWLDVEDQGISFATPDNPQRQMRVRTLERRQWIDPRDGAEYTVEVPQVDSVGGIL